MVESTALSEKPAVKKTHWGVHVDEVAIKMLQEKVSGDTSRLYFLLNANEVSVEDKVEMIGAGGGALDEHTNGGRSGRREHSAFTLAVKQLGLEEDARTTKLAEFINRVDSGAGSDPYDLSKVIQAIHRANVGSSEDGANWCLEVLRCYWDEGKQYFLRPAKECGAWFEKLGCIWLGARFGGQKVNDLIKRFFTDKIELTFDQAVVKVGKKDDPAINQMARFFRNGCERMLQPFALPRALAAINSKKGIRTAVKLARVALDAKLEAEKSFQQAKEEVDSGETFKAGRFQVYRTTTASKNVKDAILKMRKEISVIMQRNSYSGSVQIFSRATSGVRFEELAAAIRLEELRLKDKPTDELFPEELKGAGNTCGVMNWYLIVRRKEGGVWRGSYMLLNGSDSYPNVPKTRISWDRLKEIVIDVLGRQR